MGIIQQQTIKGTFYTYIGILVGFVTSHLIHPNVLTPEQVGLIAILTFYSQMFAQFSILGFNGTGRYFPYFRDEKNNHNGYLALFVSVAIAGFVLFSALAVILKDVIVNQEVQKSEMFDSYYWYLIPLTFFTLFFNVFDIYSQRLYDTTTGRVLNEFAKRIFILIATLFIAFKLLPFHRFMPVWLLANIIPAFILCWRLYQRKRLTLKPNFRFINNELRSKLIKMSFFAIITGPAPLLIQNVGLYMINRSYGLDSAGIYAIAFFLGTIIVLPTRSLYPIAYTVIAESWKSGDLKNIRTIYQKSCINQLIAALFIFVLIWANVDWFLILLPPEYAQGKYVIMFIGLANVIDAATGTSGVILGTSRYFKYDSLFYFSLIGVAVAANLLFIPLYGITGAAIAFMVTALIFNVFRYLFTLLAFKMQPFSFRNLLVIGLAVAVYFIAIMTPEITVGKELKYNHLVSSILSGGIRSLVILTLFLGSVYVFRLSEDINDTVSGLTNKYFAKTGVRQKKLP